MVGCIGIEEWAQMMILLLVVAVVVVSLEKNKPEKNLGAPLRFLVGSVYAAGSGVAEWEHGTGYTTFHK